MSAYTPGPWHIDEDMRRDMEWNRHIYGTDGMAICFLAHSDGKAPARDGANARLIAAAPELLEALRQIAAYRPLTFAECSDAEAVMGIAERAIAKAEAA